MENPQGGAAGSSPTIAPEAARLAFRQKREAAGYSQIGLALHIGCSTAYVAQIENGRLNPSPEARAALADALGESAYVLFAAFPTPQVERRAALGAWIAREYDKRKPDTEIAEVCGMSPSAVRTRRLLAGRASRPNLATFKPPSGHLTATAASEKYELDCRRLCNAIRARIVPGNVHDVAGSHPVYTVDERGLVEYLAHRPPCLYETCDRRATIASHACGGAHARALETRGTRRPVETCRRIAEGKKGKPRPDLSGKMPGHAGVDKERKYRWNVALVEGRARISTPEAAARMKRRAARRLTGLLGARQSPDTGRPTVEKTLAKTEEGRAKLALFREVREKHPSWGRPALVAHTGLVDSQVRALLAAEGFSPAKFAA